MKRSWSWIPMGVMLALLLSLAVAWAFRDRVSRVEQCAQLYAGAVSAVDTARVDSTTVPMSPAGQAVTCGEVVGRTP